MWYCPQVPYVDSGAPKEGNKSHLGILEQMNGVDNLLGHSSELGWQQGLAGPAQRLNTHLIFTFNSHL